MAQIITSGRRRPALDELLQKRGERRQEDAQLRMEDRQRQRSLADLEEQRAYDDQQDLVRRERDLDDWKAREEFKATLKAQEEQPVDEGSFLKSGFTGALTTGKPFSFNRKQAPSFSQGLGLPDDTAQAHFRARPDGLLEVAMTGAEGEAAEWEVLPQANSESIYSLAGVNYPWGSGSGDGSGGGSMGKGERFILVKNPDSGEFVEIKAQPQYGESGKLMGYYDPSSGTTWEAGDENIRGYGNAQRTKAMENEVTWFEDQVRRMPWISFSDEGGGAFGEYTIAEDWGDTGWFGAGEGVAAEDLQGLTNTLAYKYQGAVDEYLKTNPSRNPWGLMSQGQRVAAMAAALNDVFTSEQYAGIADQPFKLVDDDEPMPLKTYFSNLMVGPQ